MQLEKILLVLRSDAPSAVQIDAAMTLAATHGAEVEGLCVLSEPVLPFDDDYAIGAAAIDDVLSQRDDLALQAIDDVRIPFERAAKRRSLRTSWTVVAAGDSLIPATCARVADLVIARNPGPADTDGRLYLAGLVSRAGAPCLIVPDTAALKTTFDPVVVAWNGSREAKRAVDDALVFLRSARDVRILAVGEAATPETATAADLRHHLARHGIAASEAHRDRRRGVGETILAACEEFGAGLLVMGAYGRSRMSEALLGGATQTVLTKARIPVLLSH